MEEDKDFAGPHHRCSVSVRSASPGPLQWQHRISTCPATTESAPTLPPATLCLCLHSLPGDNKDRPAPCPNHYLSFAALSFVTQNTNEIVNFGLYGVPPSGPRPCPLVHQAAGVTRGCKEHQQLPASPAAIKNPLEGPSRSTLRAGQPAAATRSPSSSSGATPSARPLRRSLSREGPQWAASLSPPAEQVTFYREQSGCLSGRLDRGPESTPRDRLRLSDGELWMAPLEPSNPPRAF